MVIQTHHATNVVVAHDYLTQRGGAERVALELAAQLHARSIVTGMYRPDQTFGRAHEFDIRPIDSRLLRRLAHDPRRALPFLAHAWSSAPTVDADVIVCSSSGWAHGLRAADGQRKVVYCHNPARWLYQPDDYSRGMSAPLRLALGALSPGLRRWDRRAAHSADTYIANSTIVASRIARTYGIEAAVVHPPVSIDASGTSEAVPGLEAGFFLTVARPRGYKGTEVLRDAFARLRGEQLVIVGAALAGEQPPNVTSLGEVSESHLRWLYRNARALISVSHEDFGLTPIEANAFGTPALVLRAGGFLDSVQEGVSGMFIEADTEDAVVDAVRDFSDAWNRERITAHAGTFSPEAFGAKIRDVVFDAGAVRSERAGRESRSIG